MSNNHPEPPRINPRSTTVLLSKRNQQTLNISILVVLVAQISLVIRGIDVSEDFFEMAILGVLFIALVIWRLQSVTVQITRQEGSKEVIVTKKQWLTAWTKVFAERDLELHLNSSLQSERRLTYRHTLTINLPGQEPIILEEFNDNPSSSDLHARLETLKDLCQFNSNIPTGTLPPPEDV